MKGSKKGVTEQIMSLLNQEGVLRPRDLDAHQISRRYLSRLFQRVFLYAHRGEFIHQRMLNYPKTKQLQK